jgi:hypothetical protein
METKRKLQMIQITKEEWFNALRVPTPVKNKKKYYRKEKHKTNTRFE